MKLKRIYMTWIAMSGCLLGQAQEAGVEQSVWGVQGGLLSVWGYNESRLSDAVALRSEVGLMGGFSYSYTSIFGGYSRYIVVPELTVEPRWYYDLARRQAKARRTAYNSANYFSLRTSFYPKRMAISDAYTFPANMLTIVPMWGIRRHYGMHFCLEAGAGAGCRHIFGETGNARDRDEFVLNWHFCVGYTF
ncbi:MAG: hypothetical protein LBB90_02550 [Tannerella sp.]|jgi:hypothetical protein|nr:hypothetical protein [Tannerella sp.]